MSLRRTQLGVVALIAALSLGMTLAQPVPSGGFSSDNVEWLANIPIHNGTAGGKLVDDHYYLTDPRGVFIYDVSDPTAPQMVGRLPAIQGSTHVVFAQEEPDTNGEILLVNGFHPSGSVTPLPGFGLLVVDVSDKSNPTVIGSLAVYDHTWTCVLDCTYAIGRTGHIVDLTDPTQPDRVASWRDFVEGDDYMHDFVEVAPGRVIGAGQLSFYLDLTDPRSPVELARLDSDFHSLGYHGAVWPNNGTDPLMLLGAEVDPQGALPVGDDCTDESVHAVATFDATDVLAVDRKQFGPHAERGREQGRRQGHERQREQAQFHKLHEWRIAGRGVYADGLAPGHTLFCGHWFDPHPDWDAGGVLAIAHYDWGTRFLDVGADGAMEEIGWFQPIQGYTGAATWVTDEIVYVHDYRRGLDVLRFNRG
jgi:hypothetical protein